MLDTEGIIFQQSNIIDFRIAKIRKINKTYNDLRESLYKTQIEKVVLEKRVKDYELQILEIKKKLNDLDVNIIKDLKL